MKKNIYLIALILVLVGGLNWGLVGLFNVDLVAKIFGDYSTASRIIYVLVGLSALLLLLIKLNKIKK